MPFRTIRLIPGVDLEQSPTLNQTQLAQSNLIRFYGKLVQKIGGWQQLVSTTLTGICRGLHGWADLLGNSYVAAGTEQRLEVLSGGVLSDITPVVQTTNPAVSFTTVISTTTVKITDASRSPLLGDWINLITQVSVGGIVLFGFYQVTSVIDGTHYDIVAASPATANATNSGAVPLYTTVNTQSIVTVTLNNHGFTASTSIFQALVTTAVATVVIFGAYTVLSVVDANNFTIQGSTSANASTTGSENGGNARIQYLLPTGTVIDTVQSGWGTGLWGEGLWGIGSGSGPLAPLRQWSLDHWGQDLVASPNNLGIYYWQPPTIAPAIIMPNAPAENTTVYVMSQVQIVVSLGATDPNTSNQDPLLSRWCDQGDFTDWTASATNQAGSFRFPTGSALVGGLAVGLGSIDWTDQDVWSRTYLGFPLVFGFNRIATGCGLLAQRCSGSVGNLVIWLSSNHQFFSMTLGGGTPTPMECPVWDFYWNNTDKSNLGQYHCAVNSNFNEMAWHFPIALTSPLYNPLAPMAYVKFNYVENAWDYGLSSQYQRTAWNGPYPDGAPIGTDLSGLIQAHEVGTDANGVGMQWSWQTGYFSLMEGEDFIFADMIIPDMVSTGGPTFTPSVEAVDWPFAGPSPVTVPLIGPLSQFVTFSARGRQLSFGLAGSDLGTFNRLGAFRVRYQPNGKN